MQIARQAEAVWVTKGKKVFRFDPAQTATDDEIAALILGRSGTLRAPAFIAGRTLMVGYNEAAYGDLLG